MAAWAGKVFGGRSGRRAGGLRRAVQPGGKMQPPLTPMIDVTFQLLLFFLLATTFRQAEGQIPGTLPQRPEGAGLDQNIVKPIRISILPGSDRDTAAYQIAGSGAAIASPQELYRQLAARRAAYGSDQVPVAIQPRWDVAWEHVVEADNQAHRAGFRIVGIGSPP